MKTLQKLYMRDFLGLLTLLTLGLTSIFTLIDVIERVGGFKTGKTSAASIALYIAYNIPKFLIYLLPMSVLICSLFTFGQAHRRKEITAIKTAGGQLKILFLPFVGVGILLSLLAFIVSEVVAPDFATKAITLRDNMEGKPKYAFIEGGLWLKNRKGAPVKIDLYIIDQKIAQGVTVFIIGDNTMKEKLMAKKAFWSGSQWIFEDVIKYDIEKGTRTILKRMEYPDLESPDLFSEQMRGTDEMGILELGRYMKRLKQAGFRNTKVAVAMHAKLSFPLINMVMILLGISLSMRMRLGGGLLNAGAGLLISLAYWFGFTFTLTMGYSGILSPFLAAWSVPLSFCVLSLTLFLKIPE